MNWSTSLLPCLILGWLAGICLQACVDTVPVAENPVPRVATPKPVPLKQSTPGRAISPYTLAIIPWNTTRREAETEWNGLDALRTALANAAFEPVMSAYDVPNQQAKRFSETDRKLRERFWGWRHPAQGPIQEAVWKLGEELGVDAVLAYGMEPKAGTDFLWVFLYDIPYKRCYVLDGTCYYYETESAGVLSGLTQTLFGTFRDDRARGELTNPHVVCKRNR